jgi:hypothetical protein
VNPSWDVICASHNILHINSHYDNSSLDFIPEAAKAQTSWIWNIHNLIHFLLMTPNNAIGKATKNPGKYVN